MKAFILAILLFVVPVSASAKLPDGLCTEVSTMIFFAATGRDLGSTPQAIVDGLVSNGLPLSLAMRIGKLVFIDKPDATPNELSEAFFNHCTSEAV